MHVEGYISIVVLAGLVWNIAEFRLMKWQHQQMWKDYERRHGMNGGERPQRFGQRKEVDG